MFLTLPYLSVRILLRATHAALLIRPNGFVAWRSYTQNGDLEQKLEQTLTRILFREPVQATKQLHA